MNKEHTKKEEVLLGQFAVREGYITKRDLLACLRMQVLADKLLEKHFRIGEIMFIREVMSPEKYFDLLERLGEEDTAPLQRAPLFGQIVIEEGFVDLDQLLECLDVQKMEDLEGKPHRLIGEIMLDRGYLNREELERAVRIMKKKSFPSRRPRK